MEQYAKIQQILKKEEGQKERKPIYPPTVIQAVFDAKTGASLEAILTQFNSIYVQYQGTPEATRCIIPKEMRRAGLTITYMNMDSETITERAASAVQKDNDHWGLDVNWSRVDELSLSGDISVSAQGTWIINGEDTGIKALGPKGDAGLTPWLKTIDNRLHLSYDNVNWEPCSEHIAAYFRFNATSGNTQSGTIGKIQISRDNKTWNDLSPEFTNNLHIAGYVATTSALPSNKPVGTIYGVGPTYAAEDTAQTNPIYRLHVYNGTTWVDNGQFTSIAAGIVQETGDSETEVMSQKATTEKLTELASIFVNVGDKEKIINSCIKSFSISTSGNIPNLHFNLITNSAELFRFIIKDDDDNIVFNYYKVKSSNTDNIHYIHLYYGTQYELSAVFNIEKLAYTSYAQSNSDELKIDKKVFNSYYYSCNAPFIGSTEEIRLLNSAWEKFLISSSVGVRDLELRLFSTSNLVRFAIYDKNDDVLIFNYYNTNIESDRHVINIDYKNQLHLFAILDVSNFKNKNINYKIDISANTFTYNPISTDIILNYDVNKIISNTEDINKLSKCLKDCNIYDVNRHSSDKYYLKINHTESSTNVLLYKVLEGNVLNSSNNDQVVCNYYFAGNLEGTHKLVLSEFNNSNISAIVVLDLNYVNNINNIIYELNNDKIFAITDLFTLINIKGSSIYANKKLLAIGDSMTAAGKWQSRISDVFGMSVETHALGGSTIIGTVDGYNSLEPLSVDKVKDKDVIIWLAGYNNRQNEYGEKDDIYPINNTIYGMMNYVINKIYTLLRDGNNLKCKLFIVAPHCVGKYRWSNINGYEEEENGNTVRKLSEVICNAAINYNIPCINLWEKSGINKFTWDIYGANPNAIIDGSEDTEAPYPNNGDQLHCSTLGYYQIADTIMSYMYSPK